MIIEWINDMLFKHSMIFPARYELFVYCAYPSALPTTTASFAYISRF